MTKSIIAIMGLSLLLFQGQGQGQPASGPLRVSRDNPRYFADASGKAVYLAGSQSGGWDVQDDAFSGYVAIGERVRFDFRNYVQWAAARNQNLIRIWIVETTLFDKGPQDQIATPMQFMRTGPGNALDGRPRFDLTRHEPAYYNRLRAAVTEAQARGIYAMVMLFEGFSSAHLTDAHWANPSSNPWIGHPFNGKNNINGIDADLNGDGRGGEYHSLASSAVVDLQKAYVRKVVDSLNDLDNVIYEIANESTLESREWQYEIIRTIHQYESGKPKQHPVLMSAYFPGNNNSALFGSPAEAIAPSTHYRENPAASTGEKVVFADQDHNGWDNKDPRYAWMNFVRGNNVILYDPDVIPFDWERGVVRPDDKSREAIRQAVGQTRQYAGRIDLSRMTPQGILSSTAYCLAKTGSEYLVYQPESGDFTVDLAAGKYSFEWFDPARGSVVSSGSLVAAGGSQAFTPPFAGCAVLYLKTR